MKFDFGTRIRVVDVPIECDAPTGASHSMPASTRSRSIPDFTRSIYIEDRIVLDHDGLDARTLGAHPPANVRNRLRTIYRSACDGHSGSIGPASRLLDLDLHDLNEDETRIVCDIVPSGHDIAHRVMEAMDRILDFESETGAYGLDRKTLAALEAGLRVKSARVTAKLSCESPFIEAHALLVGRRKFEQNVSIHVDHSMNDDVYDDDWVVASFTGAY